MKKVKGIFVCECLIAVFYYLKKGYREHRAQILSDVHRKRMRDSTDKLQKGKFLPGSCMKGAETGSNSQRHINKVHP